MTESRCAQVVAFGVNARRKGAVETVLGAAVAIDVGYLLQEEISEAM